MQACWKCHSINPRQSNLHALWFSHLHERLSSLATKTLESDRGPSCLLLCQSPGGLCYASRRGGRTCLHVSHFCPSAAASEPWSALTFHSTHRLWDSPLFTFRFFVPPLSMTHSKHGSGHGNALYPSSSPNPPSLSAEP